LRASGAFRGVLADIPAVDAHAIAEF